MRRVGYYPLITLALAAAESANAQGLHYDIRAKLDAATGIAESSAVIALPRTGAERRFVIDRRMAVMQLTADRKDRLATSPTERPFPGLVEFKAPGGARSVTIKWRGLLQRTSAKPAATSGLQGIELFLDQAWMPISDDLSPYTASLELDGVPSSWGVVADGTWRRHGDQIHLERTTPGVDVNLIAEPDMRRRGSGAAEIWAAAHSDEAVATVRKAAEAVMAHHKALFGSTPPKTLRIVLANRTEGPSYARGSFVVLKQPAGAAPHPLQIASLLAHELTHVWWMPPVDLSSEDYWMVEAVPTYMANRYVIGLGAGVTAADWERARTAAAKMGPSMA